MLGDPRQRVRAPAHDDHHGRRSGIDNGLDELLLHAGKTEVAGVTKLAARAVGHQTGAATDEADSDVGRARVGDGRREAFGARAAHARALRVGDEGRDAADAFQRRDGLGVVRAGREVAVGFDQPPLAVLEVALEMGGGAAPPDDAGAGAAISRRCVPRVSSPSAPRS